MSWECGPQGGGVTTTPLLNILDVCAYLNVIFLKLGSSQSQDLGTEFRVSDRGGCWFPAGTSPSFLCCLHLLLYGNGRRGSGDFGSLR